MRWYDDQSAELWHRSGGGQGYCAVAGRSCGRSAWRWRNEGSARTARRPADPRTALASPAPRRSSRLQPIRGPVRDEEQRPPGPLRLGRAPCPRARLISWADPAEGQTQTLWHLLSSIAQIGGMSPMRVNGLCNRPLPGRGPECGPAAVDVRAWYANPADKVGHPNG